ncbi:MAG: DUF3047 domain-containing protein [Rubrivivax sp.]|nr:DUF3047 domain-containing protein [Rubrivivax sp.]
MIFRAMLYAGLLALTGCATTPPTADAEGWRDVALPGKPLTRYSRSHKDGRPAIEAVAERSASMWRRHVHREPGALGEVSFSWWVPGLHAEANVAIAGHEDAAARVLFAFDGEIARLPMRTRALFDLSEALTGERPPFATLMYVWDASAPVGTVIVNPRSDRIRKIVVDSGPAHLRRWRDHRRDLVADYRLAFGEDPGPLVAIAVMTDSDNTASQARAWYGKIDLH